MKFTFVMANIFKGCFLEHLASHFQVKMTKDGCITVYPVSYKKSTGVVVLLFV